MPLRHGSKNGPASPSLQAKLHFPRRRSGCMNETLRIEFIFESYDGPIKP